MRVNPEPTAATLIGLAMGALIGWQSWWEGRDPGSSPQPNGKTAVVGAWCVQQGSDDCTHP